MIADRHRRFPDVRMPRQRVLYLRRFDPEPSDLHLRVHPPGELDAALREQTSQVSRPVDPLLSSLGVGKENLPRQHRLLPVAERQVATADGNLSVNLAGLSPRAEEQCLGVHDGASDRHGDPLDPGLLVDDVLQRHGRLCGSEAVHKPAVVGRVPPVRLEVLAADFLPS